MSNMRTLLFDCDGVLYPLTQLPIQNIVLAMKETYRQDLGLSGEEQQKISEETRQTNHLGMFNYIKAICEYKNYDFEKFCMQMAERIDYSNITYNRNLTQMIFRVAKYYNVGILTNNSRAHLAKVLKHALGKSLEETEANGVRVFDITTTEENGIFWRKQPEGLALICQRNGYQPVQTTLFDDTPSNVGAAREIGMYGVLIGKQMSLQKALLPFLKAKENIIER